MAAIRETVDQDQIIEHVREKLQCTVLYCEGRPCLEYKSNEELDNIAVYIRDNFDKDLLDVFFIAVESLPVEV